MGPLWNNIKPDEDSGAVCVILTDQFMSQPPNGLYFTGLLKETAAWSSAVINTELYCGIELHALDGGSILVCVCVWRRLVLSEELIKIVTATFVPDSPCPFHKPH